MIGVGSIWLAVPPEKLRVSPGPTEGRPRACRRGGLGYNRSIVPGGAIPLKGTGFRGNTSWKSPESSPYCARGFSWPVAISPGSACSPLSLHSAPSAVPTGKGPAGHLRLDWLMWFAAMPSLYYDPWFVRLLERILQGDRPTLALLDGNPFPEAPPKFVRALHYRYRFTTPEERRRTGAWWHRDLAGIYFPPVSREELWELDRQLP
ncbi:lipase maturation factor family protein [Geomesophilobacter sediminis]|nr:lipase maturation factor family protein [Geomesophilobacter sediminis]